MATFITKNEARLMQCFHEITKSGLMDSDESAELQGDQYESGKGRLPSEMRPVAWIALATAPVHGAP